MRKSHPQPLDSLLNDTTLLRDIQQRAITLVKLNLAVKSLLPKALQPYCRVANYRKGILVLETANASWLSRLRYEQSNLITTLRSEILPSLVAINIQINPILMTNVHPIDNTMQSLQQPPRKLSINSAKLLNELAEKSPEGLKNKLKRLADLAYKDANSTSRQKKD